MQRLEVIPVNVALTLFETAEYLGYGEGYNPQMVVSDFEPGTVISVEVPIPDTERDYWVLCLNGDAPSSAIAMKAEWVMPNSMSRKTVIFFHEGWIGQMVCPYGLKPIRENSVFRIWIANVTDYTGDEDFDRFVPFAQKVHGGPKTVTFAHTCFMFRVYREYFDKMDELVRNALGLG